MWSETDSLCAEVKLISKLEDVDEIAIFRHTFFLQAPKNCSYRYSIHVFKIDFMTVKIIVCNILLDWNNSQGLQDV